MNLGNQ